MKLTDCPKFNGCSAPVCPLDPGHLKTAHLPGERACLYLREALKPGGEARLMGVLPREQAERVLQALPEILSRYGSLRRALIRASKNPSKLESVA